MTNRTARNRPRADRAERKRVARNRAERTRVARDRAERMRVVRDRAERTRSRYASVRAFVERLNAQPYELFKPRHRPPLSSRQFSLSTRHALPSQLLSGCLCLINSCRPSVAGYPLSALCCLITRCQPPVAIQQLSSLCWHSPVVGQWGGKGSLPSVSHSRRTNGREAEMSLSSWRWIWSNQDLSNQDGNEDANNN